METALIGHLSAKNPRSSTQGSPFCIVCEADTGRFWFSKNKCNLYRCIRCGLIFPFPIPTATAQVYSTDYFCGAHEGYGYGNYESTQETNNYTFQNFLDRIEKAKPGRGKLLDVGAATGTFLDTALLRGWDVEGVEISEYASEQCRRRGLNVHTGTLEAAKLSVNSFDVVTLWDVFEHVDDPQAVLKRIVEVLKPHGLLVMNMPDAGSWYARASASWWPLIVPPEHLFLFNQQNLTTLLNRFDFEVLTTARIGKRFNLSYIMQVMYTVRYQKIWKKLAEMIQKTPLNKLRIPLNLRDNVFVVARLK